MGTLGFPRVPRVVAYTTRLDSLALSFVAGLASPLRPGEVEDGDDEERVASEGCVSQCFSSNKVGGVGFVSLT